MLVPLDHNHSVEFRNIAPHGCKSATATANSYTNSNYISASMSSSFTSSSYGEGGGFMSTTTTTTASYSMLLRTELFGAEMGGGCPLSPSTPEKVTTGGGISRKDYLCHKNSASSPNKKNMFRFKSAGASSPKPESPYSLSPVGADIALSDTMPSPRKALRKVPPSPYKVFLIGLTFFFLFFC